MKDEKTVSKIDKHYILFRAVPTMRCNYNCKYCFVEQSEKRATSTMFDMHSPDEWIAAMRRFSQYDIEFYFWGGEPFLLDGTYDLVRGWTAYDHVISGSRIDTNMYFADKIAQRCATDKIKLNCSWHTQYDTLDSIFGKVCKLARLGMVGMTNFVASPYNLSVLQNDYRLTLDDLVRKFEDVGVFLNIAADFNIVKDQSRPDYEEYKRIILKYVCPEDWKQLRGEKSAAVCRANKHFFTVHPNGDIAPCLSKKACGNFFEGTLQLSEYTVCTQSCPSLVAYPFREDNNFSCRQHLVEYVNRNREYRQAMRGSVCKTSVLSQINAVSDCTPATSVPAVSVVLPTYNHLQFLPQAIECMRRQTYRDFELIIVNDGSTDGTREYLEKLNDPWIRIIHQENKRLPAALNTGFAAARGKYLTWISADNIYVPQFIEKLVEALETNPKAGLAYGGHAIVDEKGTVTRQVRCATLDHAQMLTRFPGMAAFMYRRECHNAVGMYDTGLEGAEDWDMWLRIAEKFSFTYVDTILCFYRLHSQTMTAQKTELIMRTSDRAFNNAICRLNPASINATKEQLLYVFDMIRKASDARDAQLSSATLRQYTGMLRQYDDMAATHRQIKAAYTAAQKQGVSIASSPRKTIQASTIKSENTAVDYFLNAQDEFSRGNFAAAVTGIQQYKSVMDYSKLPQIVNSAKDDKTPDISVVVVTYNRSDDVKKCLESLWNQNNTGYSFEVIVVDNGGSSVDSFKQYVNQYIKCPINFNLSEGRNIGAHFANGRILVFLDDDAMVGSNYLLSIKMAFDKLDIFGLRGRAYPKSDPDANKGVSIYNLGDSPFPSYCNQEGNSAFRRDIYLEMGGMDPLLFGHEGSDLTYRIIKAYKQPNKIIYWPWTIIYHDFGSLEKAAEKKKLHQLSSDYLKFKHNADIFVSRKEIERCPLPIKQTFVPQAQNHPAPKSLVTPAIAAGSIKPKVSIVIACHNSQEFLPQCLDSIRNQTMTEWELLLLDDASTDGTRDIIENYSRMDARIKPSYFKDKQGPYTRRNFAIERAASDFIVIQDSDDIMCPAKLQRLYEEIIKDKRLGVVGSFYRLFLDEFKGLEYTEGVELPLIHEQIMEKYKTHLYICWHASAIIRKSLFDAIGLYDENPYGSDKLWLAKAAEYVQYTSEITFANIPEYLTLKREHASSQQGVLPPIDPRSRRAMFQAYWVEKLAKISEKFQKTPGLDVKAELKNCKCNDYIQRFSHLFEKWESRPLDENMLYKFVSKGIIEFKEARHVTCLITLDGVEKISSAVAERFKNYDLLRGMASFVLDRKVKSIEYLNREIRNHNSPAAKQFIADFFENHSKTDVHRWCTENDSRYDLQIIDLGKAGDRQQAQISVAEKQPLVSVIMPAYNAAEYIAKAIESALNQTYKNFELIIINDGSTDQTENIILGFNDKRIKYSRQENRGLAATHNTGIIKSAGEFVIKLDADDMMTPDFIERHIVEFERHTEVDLVYCDDLLIDERNQSIRVINRPEYMDTKLLIRDLFRCGFPVVPFRTCIRKNVFDKIGYFDESLHVAEDYDMIRRFVKHGLRVHHLPAALYLRRIASDSLSRKFSAEKAKSHFDVVKRYSDTFVCEELFPDVDWNKIAPEKRKLQAKCLSAVTCFTIGQSYVKTAPVYAKTAFDQACSELDECFRMDPANPHVQQLLRKYEALRTQCEQAVQEAVY